MNRKICTSILVALVCLTLGFLTGCSSSSSTPPPPTIAVTAVAADQTQSTTVNTAFANPLGVNVTSNGSADSGATVTYAATTSSGGATCALSATTATTNSSGQASVTCTANGTAGSYTVTATVSGASSPATFTLTNTSATSQTVTYVFSASGTELPSTANGDFYDYYAIAGAVTFTTSGTFVGGEQDYNDGAGITAMDAMTNASISVNEDTGQGTVTVVTADTNVGNQGTETFAVQFVNQNHAVISQFDGTATSSGSLDLQTATETSNANFAYTLSGIDINYEPVGYGGVLTLAANGSMTGAADVNDDGVAEAAGATATNLGGQITSNPVTDGFGRGTATLTITSTALPVSPTTLSIAFYIVGTEVIRIIDVDAEGAETSGPAAVGSLYGQGTNATGASNSSLVTSVFGIESNSDANELYAAAGQIMASGGAITTGEGDEDGDDATFEASPLGGSYSIASNGYGSISLTGLGPVASLGVYMTDPMLNVVDPNNTSTELAGGLILDMDTDLSGGVGVVVPQGTVAADGSDFSGPYGLWGQDFNAVGEFDFVGQTAVASLVLTASTAEVSDPEGFFVSGTGAEYNSGTLLGTATAPDTFGRFSLPLGIAPTTTMSEDFTVGVYEVDSNLFFWISTDEEDTFLGTLESQTTASRVSDKGKPAPKVAVSKKR